MTFEPVRAGFCVAPWLESVLYNDGKFRICSRNDRSFGDWRREPLSTLWASAELQEFRRSIRAGQYPDEHCAACQRAGSAQTFSRILTAPIEAALRRLRYSGFDEIIVRRLDEVLQLLSPVRFSDVRAAELENVAQRALNAGGEPETSHALALIVNSLRVVRAFHAGELKPPVVGPFRQVQLIARCNARCVMCPGNFTGELETGSSLDEAMLPHALEQPQDIVDFFCNGSEFLLHRGWKEIARRLKASGCASLRISTNGMLLNSENGRHLIDENLIGHLNISLNAAKPDTLERVQKNVRYQRLESNVHEFLAYAEERGAEFPLSFSFILLRSTIHELPDYLRLIHSFASRCQRLRPNAMIMSLENAGVADYRAFLFEEHPGFMPFDERKKILVESAALADQLGITTNLYNFGNVATLRELLEAGGDIPAFIPLPIDLVSIEACARDWLEPIFAEALSQGERLIAEEYSRLASDFLERSDAFPEQLLPSLATALDARLSSPPPMLFRYLFPAHPKYEQHFLSYSRSYAGHLKLRFRQRLEDFHREKFAEAFGAERKILSQVEALARSRMDPAFAEVARAARRAMDQHFSKNFYPIAVEDFTGALRALVAKAEGTPPEAAVFFAAHSKSRIRYEEYFADYARQLGRQLGALEREAFALAFGYERDALPVHRGVRYIPAQVESLRVGQRVLCRDYEEYVFAGMTEKETLLWKAESGDFGYVPADFVIGCFYAEPQRSMPAPPSLNRVCDWQQGLPAGAVLIDQNFRTWIFLVARGSVFYVVPRGKTELTVLPADSLARAVVQRVENLSPDLEGGRRKALVHWRIHSVKRRILGQQKGLLLWPLSWVYRLGLRYAGFKMPANLVIRD